MSKFRDLYQIRSLQEDEIGIAIAMIYDCFVLESISLPQLNASRQEIEEWLRFELGTEEKRKICFVFVHLPTQELAGIFMHKNYSTLMEPLPKNCSSLAPRYILTQQIRTHFTKQRKLDVRGVLYGDVAVIHSRHRGGKLATQFFDELMRLSNALGYKHIFSETSNAYFLKLLLANGFEVLGTVTLREFELDGRQPFMNDARLTVSCRAIESRPKL